jgi:hypothetical protein
VHALNGFLHSDAGLFARIALGVLIFTALALVDYARHRERATRWREYSVLLLAVAGAILYGVVNDQITSAVSWEYFYYGKGLEEQLGPATPPATLALHLAAAVVGIKATWSAGLLIGVALLLANNPSRALPRLPNWRLLRLLPMILLITACIAAVGGIVGYAGLPARWNDDFAQMLRRDEMRPHRLPGGSRRHRDRSDAHSPDAPRNDLIRRVKRQPIRGDAAYRAASRPQGPSRPSRPVQERTKHG